MAFGLNRIGQIALAVSDIDKAEAFYQHVLQLRKLYRYGNLSFFDCDGVRLLLEKATDPENIRHASLIYFSCPDIGQAAGELERRGVVFKGKPHLVAPMTDHDLWMAFFEDPDGHTLALMHEAPKGYGPQST